MEHLYHKGIAHKDWYSHVRNAAYERFAKDAVKWLAFFALTSPNASVQTNCTLATKALRQFNSQEPFHGFMRIVIKHLNDFRATGTIEYGNGIKVKSFFANLIGDEESVTVDRWISRAAGYSDNIKSMKQYHEVANIIKTLARAKGVSNAQCQAAIWAGQLLHNSNKVTDVASVIRRL